MKGNATRCGAGKCEDALAPCWSLISLFQTTADRRSPLVGTSSRRSDMAVRMFQGMVIFGKWDRQMCQPCLRTLVYCASGLYSPGEALFWKDRDAPHYKHVNQQPPGSLVTARSFVLPALRLRSAQASRDYPIPQFDIQTAWSWRTAAKGFFTARRS